jgi:antitoxin VapB
VAAPALTGCNQGLSRDGAVAGRPTEGSAAGAGARPTLLAEFRWVDMVEFWCTHFMALNLKNREVERLAAEVARLARETKTEAIRKALIERKARLQVAVGRGSARNRLLEFLERAVWPKIPPEALGHPLSKEEEDAILGYGPGGY